MAVRALLNSIRGATLLLFGSINTILCIIPLYLVAMLKWLVPGKRWATTCNRLLNGIAGGWISINNIALLLLNRIRWDIQGTEYLEPDGWYLVLSNHQTWADIFVLQKALHRKVPLLKFFLKKELMWMPLLGPAWKALDFPFMKRYSKKYLEKHPEMAGKDLEITRKTCEKFKTLPISVMNFVEGTRFSDRKHRSQDSPYVHLLRPKAGGIALVLAAMGNRMRHVLNVTIAYPGGAKGFWAFLCGNVREISVRVESLFIQEELIGDYFHDPAFRERFQQWLSSVWADKDRLLDSLARAPHSTQVQR